MTAPGIRNHNPGNIELGAPWQGLVPAKEDTAYARRFCTFKAPEWGIRAIARVLITYQDKRRAGDGSRIDTVQEFIDRWAPPVENDTSAYATHVRQKMGVESGEILEITDYETMRGLVEAIIYHENGSQPYSDATIRKALTLAGIEAPTKPLTQSRTIKAGQVAVGATGLGMAAEAAQQIAPALPMVKMIGEYAPWAIGVLVIAAIGYMIWCRIEDNKLRGA